MNEKFNKLITVLLLFSFFLFNVFGIISNVAVVSANEIEMDDSLIFGTLVNASQGGRGGQGLRTGNRALSDSLSRDNRGGGMRLGDGGPGRGTYRFNPSLVDIDLLYNDYRTFINNSSFTNDHQIFPMNRTYHNVNNVTERGDLKTGVMLITGNPTDTYNHFANYNDNNFDFIRGTRKKYAYMFYSSHYLGSTGDKVFDYRWTNSGSFPSRSSATEIMNSNNGQSGWRRIPLNNYNYHMFNLWANSANPSINIKIDYIVVTDSPDFRLNHIEIVHNNNNLPTKQEFINNYTNTFNVEYDNTTNQLVKNDTYISYNVEDFSDDSITINNEYVTNNYEIHIGDNIENDVDQKDYTNILTSILDAIKDLPQQIRDKFDDFVGAGGSEPEPVEEGKGFWASLFDAIASLVASFGDFISSIPQLILDLLEGFLGLVEKIVALFIPTAEQMDELKQSFSGLTDDLSLKFSPITESVESIKTVFSSPKSIYSLTYDFNGQTINVIPIQLQNQINNFRGVLNGVVVLTTFISIYKRFVGREDVIK